MTNPMNTILSQLRDISVEAVVAWIVMFFMLLFAMWTLAHHAATFLYIPWRSLCLASIMAILPASLLAAWGAWRFSNAYGQEVTKAVYSAGLQNISSIVLFIVITALLLVIPTYSLRFGFALTGFLFMWWLTRRAYSPPHSKAVISEGITVFSGRGGVWLLAAFTLVAVVVTLASHRPDLDDSFYIHVAAQTLRHPDLGPLTFDASLGFILEPFLFAPYRLASYETLVALLTGWTGLDILTVYYLLLPGLTAALAIGVAYLFARWFLPSGPAVLATGIFLLIMLAWGDSHIAYGNRVFVRLFQGKGLLIALTTPMSIVVGLLLLRRPSPWNWIFLALAQVAAIGVSSNGLVCTFATTALVLITAIRRDVKAVVFASGILAVTLIYPAILGVWLKFYSGWAMPLGSESGPLLPINASLGLGIREALTLSALALGFGALSISIQKSEYGLLTGAVLVLILNPWFSELLSGLSARVMSWRLAWAAPIPLLLAVAFAAVISPLFWIRPPIKKLSLVNSFIGVVALIFFLAAARWTLVASNNVTWSWPSAKLNAKYNMAKEISAAISKLTSPGTVLANREIGAWLPLVAPDLKLVMPGHTYPIMLQTVLTRSDFDSRIQLFNAINGQEVDLHSTVELMRHYKIGTLVIQNGSNAEKFIGYLFSRTDITIKEIPVVAGHRIFSLTYGYEILQ
ncbi:MAG: hypothetical protein A2169_07380 [Deltaproteobacteria bacterium RBG_13_47_9]|nr:MAG: hypothetical protein A2169_07380 [Deltaproteobacteria bacterium RBG_13_47_9]